MHQEPERSYVRRAHHHIMQDVGVFDATGPERQIEQANRYQIDDEQELQ